MKIARSHVPALIVAAAALIGAGTVLSAPEYLLVQSPTARRLYPSYGGVRLLRDDHDVVLFREHGAFLRDGTRPYARSAGTLTASNPEYPQLATYLFAAPYLFASSDEGYRGVFTFMMAVALGGTALFMTPLCAQLGFSPWRLLLLLLPGTLYFSLNRFDVVATGLVMGSLSLLFAGRIGAAHSVLGAAFLTKAYPVLYVPLFARLAWDAGRARAVLRGAAALAGTVAACTLQLALWVGGTAVLAPYLFFGGRDDNSQSAFHFVSQALPLAGEAPAGAVFRFLQAGLGLAVLAAGRLTPHKALRWLTAMTIAFVVFMRFQSPQWVLWITIPGLLAAGDRTELGLVAAQDVLAYFYFPLAFDRFGQAAPALAFVVGALNATRLILLGCLLRPSPPRQDHAVA